MKHRLHWIALAVALWIIGASTARSNRSDPANVSAYPLWVVRVPFVAGTTGAADDVTVLQGLSVRVRIINTRLVIATGVASATATLRDTAGGAGAALSSSISAAAAGRVADAMSTTTALTSSGNIFLRRSNNKVAGEVIVELLPQ